MNNLTPKGIALRISFLVATIVTIIVLLAQTYADKYNLLVLVCVYPATFISSYYGFLIAIEKFIYTKIKLVYRTIHNLKRNKTTEFNKLNLDKDILTQVREDVIEWDKTNKQEIERLKDMESYRREFVGNVSHELKTPIFNIQGYLLTLLEGGIYDENINVSYLTKANKSVERMIAIIDDLDQITKLEAGVIEMNLKKVDLIELTKETINSIDITAQEKNIKTSVVNHTNKPSVFVLADSDKISQVLVNLIVNSFKYGKEDGETKIEFFDMDEFILVEVSDNGQGIPEEHHTRLFERFYRTDKGRARNAGGSGLGLSIVKHIIEAHEQTINVRSTPDVGSTFSFTLKKFTNK
ncbi:sensor histidine kinase [Vicingus serpentipes]|uniref:histidine kinase n=1 Tax=Vicingus serpentipes TaxID=1926625 RepID=A0A5C6RS38_9FLAO|nr:ATP-binding protein [Vicingus serpentipes]TXB64755.1 sensor histidine kinase [Vicingus serpentipes]